MPRKFHIAHIVPEARRHHTFFSYNELIETILWGLRQLGHSAEYAVNQIDPTATNIIFGYHMLPMDALQRLPADTIVYSTEQKMGARPEDLKDSVLYAAGNFQVWEYSPFQLGVWQQMSPRFPIKIVPIGFAPILTRIPTPPDQDIDVLFYGTSSEQRMMLLHHLCGTGLRTIFASGFYGPSRDALIGRAKIVLNISAYSNRLVFELVRVSYLLANGKAVVADKSPQTLIEPDLANAVSFVPIDQIPAECVRLVGDDNERSRLQQRGYEAISRRDIRKILAEALS